MSGITENYLQLFYLEEEHALLNVCIFKHNID